MYTTTLRVAKWEADKGRGTDIPNMPTFFRTSETRDEAGKFQSLLWDAIEFSGIRECDIQVTVTVTNDDLSMAQEPDVRVFCFHVVPLHTDVPSPFVNWARAHAEPCIYTVDRNLSTLKVLERGLTEEM